MTQVDDDTKKRGRPRKEDKLTPAQKMARYRAKKKTEGKRRLELWLPMEESEILKEKSLAQKRKESIQAREVRQECLQAVPDELTATLARYKADPAHEIEKDAFIRGIHTGYEYGLKTAIDIINYAIGSTQDPPDIFYGMDKNS